jgi:putative acetyltransferase
MQIAPGNLTDSRVIDLVHILPPRHKLHPARPMRWTSAVAVARYRLLDGMGWRKPDAMGALKQLCCDHGELKSMHTIAAARRNGAASAVLQHVIAFARCGISRLSLETGSAITSGLQLHSTADSASLNVRHSPAMRRTPTAFFDPREE